MYVSDRATVTAERKVSGREDTNPHIFGTQHSQIVLQLQVAEHPMNMLFRLYLGGNRHG